MSGGGERGEGGGGRGEAAGGRGEAASGRASLHERGARLREDGARLHEDGARLHEGGVRLDEDGERLRELRESSNEEGERVDEDGLREDLEAAEANGCDNRGVHLRIATFDEESLFTRLSVMRFADWQKGRATRGLCDRLEAHREDTYTAAYVLDAFVGDDAVEY